VNYGVVLTGENINDLIKLAFTLGMGIGAVLSALVLSAVSWRDIKNLWGNK
jgi:hypothetical protein